MFSRLGQLLGQAVTQGVTQPKTAGQTTFAGGWVTFRDPRSSTHALTCGDSVTHPYPLTGGPLVGQSPAGRGRKINNTPGAGSAS
jgi:hypothetical protein